MEGEGWVTGRPRLAGLPTLSQQEGWRGGSSLTASVCQAPASHLWVFADGLVFPWGVKAGHCRGLLHSKQLAQSSHKLPLLRRQALTQRSQGREGVATSQSQLEPALGVQPLEHRLPPQEGTLRALGTTSSPPYSFWSHCQASAESYWAQGSTSSKPLEGPRAQPHICEGQPTHSNSHSLTLYSLSPGPASPLPSFQNLLTVSSRSPAS